MVFCTGTTVEVERPETVLSFDPRAHSDEMRPKRSGFRHLWETAINLSRNCLTKHVYDYVYSIHAICSAGFGLGLCSHLQNKVTYLFSLFQVRRANYHNIVSTVFDTIPNRPSRFSSLPFWHQSHTAVLAKRWSFRTDQYRHTQSGNLCSLYSSYSYFAFSIQPFISAAPT